jgi:hypothetical protein
MDLRAGRQLGGGIKSARPASRGRGAAPKHITKFAIILYRAADRAGANEVAPTLEPSRVEPLLLAKTYLRRNARAAKWRQIRISRHHATHVAKTGQVVRPSSLG